MALTQNQLACRELLSCNPRLHTRSSDDSAEFGDKMTRYWEGIPHGMQDDCMELLKAMVDPSNTLNIEVAGDPEPYDVTGEYKFGGATWTNGNHIISASEYLGDDVYELSNIYGEILYRSNTNGGELPNIDDATWTAIGLVNAGNSWTRPLNYDFMTGNFSTGWEYTTYGTITTAEIIPDEYVQTTVQNPQAEWKPRSGTWATHALSLDRKGGAWTISQTLILSNDGSEVLINDVLEPSFFCRYILVFPSIAQSVKNDFICSIKSNEGLNDGNELFNWADIIECESGVVDFLVESIRSRHTNTQGVYDVYVTLLRIPDDEISEEVSYDMRDGSPRASSWNDFISYVPKYDSDGSIEDWRLSVSVKPTFIDYLSRVRRVTRTVTKSYWKKEPVRPAGIATASGIGNDSEFSVSGGKKYRLSTGLWVTEGVETVKIKWKTSDEEPPPPEPEES